MNARSQITITVPEAPSQHQTRNDPDATLAWINSCVLEMLSTIQQQPDKDPVLSLRDYMVFYSAVHDCCTAGARKDKNKGGAHLLGGDIYHSLEDIIKTYCQDVRAQLHELDSNAPQTDEELLGAYIVRWKAHLALAKYIANLFRFVDRHWVKREIDEMKPNADPAERNIYPIRELLLKIWKEDVVIGKAQPDQSALLGQNEGSGTILDAMERLSERECQAVAKEGHSSRQELLEEILESLKEIGLELAA